MSPSKKKAAKKNAPRTRTNSQSSKLAKQRGAQFENEIAETLSKFLGVVVKRKLGQARDGGDDLQAGPLRIEAKRRRDIGWINDALAQVDIACQNDHGRTFPMVVTREDKGVAHVVMRFDTLLALLSHITHKGFDAWD